MENSSGTIRRMRTLLSLSAEGSVPVCQVQVAHGIFLFIHFFDPLPKLQYYNLRLFLYMYSVIFLLWTLPCLLLFCGLCFSCPSISIYATCRLLRGPLVKAHSPAFLPIHLSVEHLWIGKCDDLLQASVSLPHSSLGAL